MSGRVPSDPTLDDWFDEPQPRAERTAETVPAADDWLDGGGETSRERRAALDVGALGSRRALLAVAGAVVLVLLGLAVGGIFSGGAARPRRARLALLRPPRSPRPAQPLPPGPPR